MLSYWPEVWKKLKSIKKLLRAYSRDMLSSVNLSTDNIRKFVVGRTHTKQKETSKTSFGFLGKVSAGIIIVFGAYNFLFIGRILPNVSVAGVNISALNPEDAVNEIKSGINFPEKLIIKTGAEKYEISFDNIDVSYDVQSSVYTAYNLFRTGNPAYDTQTRISSLWTKREVGLLFTVDEEKFNETISILAGQIAKDPIYPYIWKNEIGELVVTKGENGNKINITKMKADVKNAIANLEANPITIETESINTVLTKAEEDLFLARAKSLVGKTLELTFEFETFAYADTDLYSLLEPKEGYNEGKISDITAHIASLLRRDPQNPNFVFKAETGRVEEFAPAKPGVVVDEEKLATIIKDNLQQLEDQIDTPKKIGEIPVNLTEPEITTDTVNELGIKELIGRGTSTFRGSISSRVYNVNLAATRLNGILIPPDEVFSFNTGLGDVSKLTGYKEAYVIKDGRTALGDGGGVCQVSTTLFRAALDAGLPIIERRAHSYRVGYYEQDTKGLPGLDATVYSPTTDFKFKNDTGHHILIQAFPDTTNLSLIFELYGTSDGRVATHTKPVISGTSPPPEDMYVDDPTLPAGTIKQIDWKAWGAKSSFDYMVTRNGETIYEKTFLSNYRPWQSVYLRGTGPVL